ncbi:uncharacterized protein FOMMEDRAFT_163098 [Fomitiporia mediterranea MF3/22]|uniref:Uncharacterized protein n=1 Tax=Fomitiporia mediterranea (strain MF3/22) TaxID=694068 RepID=R7SGC8_FOMME|nr:uncharacterized protein FOMMEDRAFT_163098 [Fomitiporia mediterranea MF3/22]EJC97495.1 hypothetical protein FOMMEDRAFT_163098 [Fomitiporia mediterranea MF3/22]
MKKLPIGADKTKQYWGRHPGAPSFTLLTGHKGFSIKINKGFKTDYKPEDFAEVERIDYNPSDTLSETKPAMYIPRAPNNQAFDAWFYEPQSPEHRTVLIQATVQIAPYEIKTGVLDWFGSDEPLNLIVLLDDYSGHRIFTSGLPTEHAEAPRACTTKNGWFPRREMKRWPTVPVAPRTPTFNLRPSSMVGAEEPACRMAVTVSVCVG